MTTQEIPYGYCHCGCGQQTSISTYTNLSRDRVKGEPLRFVSGHNATGRQLRTEYTRKPIEERFWSKVDKRGPDECWPWLSSTDKGYGVLAINRQGENNKYENKGAHRISYEIHYGPIPRGVHVCHKCDNPICVNPNHLFLGTLADNSHDRHGKGRSRGGSNQGESHPTAKLTENDVRAIRQQHEKGESDKEIAAKYVVTRRTINDIVNRKLWKHI